MRLLVPGWLPGHGERGGRTGHLLPAAATRRLVATLERVTAKADTTEAGTPEPSVPPVTWVCASETDFALARTLSEYPSALTAARDIACPRRVATYLDRLAAATEGCLAQVEPEDPAAAVSRQWLVRCARATAAHGMGVLGPVAGIDS